MKALRLVLSLAFVFGVACSTKSESAPGLPAQEGPRSTATSAPTREPTATPAPTSMPEPTATPRRQITFNPGEIVRGNQTRPEMSLTFDCGASGVPTPAILDALRNEGIRATFFLTGDWVSKYPDLTRQIAAEHEIGNHSWSHRDFRELSAAQMLSEMERTERIIFDLTGVSTRPLWRAPFGSRDAFILNTIRGAGWQYHIFWSADSGDWLDITPAKVRDNVVKAARNGAVIIEHCGSTQTAAVLPQIISDLKAQGFKIVPVSDLIGD